MKKALVLSLHFLFSLSSFNAFSQTKVNRLAFDAVHMPLTINQKINNGFSFSNYRNSKLYIPLTFTAYGFLSLDNPVLENVNFEVREEILEDHPHFKTSIDNYLQFAPAISTFALKLSGMPSEHKLWASTRLYLTSSILMAGTVFAIKSITHVQRPDGSTYNSFPSGHTATAFAAAEFMHQEFKHSSPLLSYSGYLAASATGTLRMFNNRHYFSDVVTGAGIGILTTKAAYWVNQKLFEKRIIKRLDD